MELIRLAFLDEGDQAFALPCDQLLGLKAKDAKDVLTGVSGHRGISVGWDARSLVGVAWAYLPLKLYSEYAVRTRANQGRLR